MGRYEGQIVAITGGARGQGREHAVQFAKEGADIAIIDIAGQLATVPYQMGSQADLDLTCEMVTSAGAKCQVLKADLRNTEETNRAFAAVVDEYDRLDVLVVNHGVVSMSPLVEMSDDIWAECVDSVLMGSFKAMRAAAPIMLKRQYGRIVAISSVVGKVGLGGIGHYVAAKAGLIALAKSLAVELAANGITVNTVCPTTVNTPMIHHPANYALFAPGVTKPTMAEVQPGFASINAIPIPWIETIDIAHAVQFLASPEARYITGAVLDVSAGAFNCV
jgi:SDR family mycofactocin-dependent oxidoreductase